MSRLVRYLLNNEDNDLLIKCVSFVFYETAREARVVFKFCECFILENFETQALQQSISPSNIIEYAYKQKCLNNITSEYSYVWTIEFSGTTLVLRFCM